MCLGVIKLVQNNVLGGNKLLQSNKSVRVSYTNIDMGSEIAKDPTR